MAPQAVLQPDNCGQFTVVIHACSVLQNTLFEVFYFRTNLLNKIKLALLFHKKAIAFEASFIHIEILCGYLEIILKLLK